MVRIQRSEKELQDVSVHLLYEVNMFLGLSRALGYDLFGKGVLTNSLLEAYIIHARVLLFFLFSENPQPDDVIAEDFLNSKIDWKKIIELKSDNLKHVQKRVGKEIAHLTYSRLKITPDSKAWNIINITNEIVMLINNFLEFVPKNNLAPSWNVLNDKDSSNTNLYIYENWVAEGHKARIHLGSCSFCNDGKGNHNSIDETNGKWHGPFTRLSLALEAAISTKGKVSYCKHCNPNNQRLNIPKLG